MSTEHPRPTAAPAPWAVALPGMMTGMGYRVIITTATGQQIAAGGRFPTEEDANDWAAGLSRYDVRVGEVVRGIPDGFVGVRARTALDMARADYRESLNTVTLAPPSGDEDLLTIEDVAGRYGVKVETVETGVLRGTKPAPDFREGRFGLWRPSTLDAWDRGAAERRRRPQGKF